MTPEEIKAEQEAIEKVFDDLWERVDKLCRAAVEKTCRETGWDFSSTYSTMFTTAVPHEYQPGHMVKHEHEDWPDDFQQMFDWTCGLPRFDFPDMIFEKGEWKA